MDSDLSTGGLQISLTQNLFNDDELWEYITPIYKTTTTISSKVSITEMTKNGTFRFARSYSVSCHCTGFEIMNEGGKSIAQLPLSGEDLEAEGMSIVRTNGKIYIIVDYYSQKERTYYNCIYQIDAITNAVKSISISTKQEHFAHAKDGYIDIQLSNEEDANNSQIAITNMAGISVASTTIPAGTTKTQISTSHFPKGIYGITLKQQGQETKTEKVFIR